MDSGYAYRGRSGAYLLSSVALHAALIGLLSLRSWRRDLSPITPAMIGDLVAVEVAPSAPHLQPRSKQPGGGGPSLRINHSTIAPKLFARDVPDRQEESPPPSVAAPSPELPRGRETVVASTVDVIAAPSPVNGLGKKPDAMTSISMNGASGTGPGSRGGPGGPGAGRGEGGVPLVSEKFSFGGDSRAAFKGVVCWIPPGTLRIADVREHECPPVAIFYTNTFDIPERDVGEGFPGITRRSSWFMIEYTGIFTVGKDGTYEFRLHSDDGSYLFIDGAMVIDNDGKHEPLSRWGSIPLKAGEHQLRLLYAQTTDRMALQLFVQPPGARDEALFTPRI